MIISPVAMPTSSRFGSSPSPPSITRSSDGGLPFRTASMSDFEIERTPKTPHAYARRSIHRHEEVEAADELQLRASVGHLIAAQKRPSIVSGRIPLDPAELVLFFRSKSGLSHSLDFPIDLEYETPPALDVLIAACLPHPSEFDDYTDRESLFYPPNLPLTTSLEISNHPILDAVRNTLFPHVPSGHYLTTMRDKLEVLSSGGQMGVQPLPTDGRAATIIVTLPSRFRGGAMCVHDIDGSIQKFHGRGGKNTGMEWTAFTSDCVYEIETLQKGCRMTLSYGVFLKTFGPSGLYPEPLITPSDYLLDLLSPILNLTRGRKIAFFLMHDYGVNPSEVLADSMVPDLKGGDSILYHAIKMYKLEPELRWTAGGYIWPIDRTVQISDLDAPGTNERSPFGILNPASPSRRNPALRGPFSTYASPGSDEEELDMMRSKVEDSGAVMLADTDILVLKDWNAGAMVGKERVPFVSSGELEKLVVNAMMVTYVP